MQLYLSRDGIFPITRDETGQPLPSRPASGLTLPGTIQGEGKLAGIPSLFIRLAGCNLHCVWHTDSGETCSCDTAYAAFRVENAFSLDTERICRIVDHNRGNIRHLVITGGEPFLQAPGLTELCTRLKSIYPFHITVETNATIYDEAAVDPIDFFSLSPKLASSTPSAPHAIHHAATRTNLPALQAFITHALEHHKDFQLKFVYAAEQDIDEIYTLLGRLQGWKQEDILLMPMGTGPRELQRTIPRTLEHCLRNGWRYCDRLHLSIFGNKPGV